MAQSFFKLSKSTFMPFPPAASMSFLVFAPNHPFTVFRSSAASSCSASCSHSAATTNAPSAFAIATVGSRPTIRTKRPAKSRAEKCGARSTARVLCEKCPPWRSVL